MSGKFKLSDGIVERVARLSEKYKASGQELEAYLDGLLYANYNTYWDYIHLDTLLRLQTPRTDFPDEEIFIMYHQITELYFKLSLHEMNQLAMGETPEAAEFLMRLQRINRYFAALTDSFGVMEKGMDRDEFLKFRMSLTPASGFQSAQYRMVEIGSTDLIELVDKDFKEALRQSSPGVEEMFAKIYWKKGATLADSGQKTLTLRQFEKKYTAKLLRMAERYQNCNLWQLYLGLKQKGQASLEIEEALRHLDLNVNVNWPLQHYRTAATYLARRPNDLAATGGTNWQRYLPPRFQKRIFYPSLWTPEEIADWGKKWVMDVLNEAR